MKDEEIDFTDARMLRRKAEELLKEQKGKPASWVMEADVKKLIHELQVHQIELEMQNEELRNVYEISEKALKKYTIMYDFAPVGYFTLDKEGGIHELNFRGAEMIGDRRFGLIGDNFKIFVSDDSKPVFNKFLSKLFRSNSRESCKVMLGYIGKPLCHVYIEGAVIDPDNKCLLSVVDLSGLMKKDIF